MERVDENGRVQILIGWFHPATGRVVTIPEFDHVDDPEVWFPAYIDADSEAVKRMLRLFV
jgi:hypothetical protein